jgi:predicted nucleic acid-binding protein
MVKVLYADTSAVVGAYLADEVEHAHLKDLLLSQNYIVLTSELTRVELASAVTAAKRTGRIPDNSALLYQFDQDSAPGNRFGVIPLAPHRVFPAARRLVTENHPLRTLDAIHLAVALHEVAPLTGSALVTMVSRDQRQADAATANGLSVL